MTMLNIYWTLKSFQYHMSSVVSTEETSNEREITWVHVSLIEKWDFDKLIGTMDWFSFLHTPVPSLSFLSNLQIIQTAVF